MAAIDYSIAGQWADHVHAILRIANDDKIRPFFFTQYYREDGPFPASANDGWIEAEIKAVASFFEIWEHLGLDRTVMAYNLGIAAVLKGERNEAYLQRFDEALNKVRAEHKS